MEKDEFCFPQLNNSCRRVKASHFQTVLSLVFLASFSALIVTLNLLVIVAISHFRQLHSPTNLLLCSLAVSDLITGTLLLLNEVLLADGCWYLSDSICAFHFALAAISTSSSAWNVVLISADRYIAVCDPLRYPMSVTSSRVRLCISLCWGCCLVYIFGLLSNNLQHLGRYKSCIGECVLFVTFTGQVFDLILAFALPILTILVLYGRVFVVAASQARATRTLLPAVALGLSVKVTAKKSELKAARNLGVVVVTFLLCICPFYCVLLTRQGRIDHSVYAVTFLFHVNACLDPLIYVFFYPWFRKALKLIVTLQILKAGSSHVRLQ